MHTYYLAVTADIYELPLAVADTAEELAQLRGTTATNVYSAISKQLPGTLLGEKYVRVEEPTITKNYATPPRLEAVTAPPLASLIIPVPKKG